jgi:hypothetical protein
MGTAEELTVNFNSMPDHPTLAMLADWGDGLDRTFKAIEGMPRACGNQLKTLVIVVPTNLARCHKPSLKTRVSWPVEH